jgi:predicted nucleic acid-binding protein
MSLCVFPQIVIELWTVCTRPIARNGLGLDVQVAERIVRNIEGSFELLPERPEVYPLWRELVVQHRVAGTKSYDARIVASAMAHAVGSILTFNGADFSRFPGIAVISPVQLDEVTG